jgi:hypothetical protein
MPDNYDERSFEERMQSAYRNRSGEDWSSQKSIENFPLYAPEPRAQALDALDLEIARTEVNNSPSALKTAAQRLALRRQLRSIHDKLLTVGR